MLLSGICKSDTVALVLKAWSAGLSVPAPQGPLDATGREWMLMHLLGERNPFIHNLLLTPYICFLGLL